MNAQTLAPAAAPAERETVWFSRWWLPGLVFAAILARGATLGLTDDEAYYWVLAQRPALGYAYHPPAVALLIAAAQRLLGPVWGHHSVALVRLPAALSGAGLVALGMRWIERAGGARGRTRGGAVLAAFAGIFALSWMIVPDFPMFLGWTLAFAATWEICQESPRRWSWPVISVGLALAILSKFSGVLAAVSVTVAVLLWAPRERWGRAAAVVALGVALAAGPILWWNSQHGWGALIYQLKERHGDTQVSWVRYLRFWGVELVLMGPAVFGYGVGLLRRMVRGSASRAEKFALIWAAPGALVFCLQPLWSDFKPHWALVVWWPLVLALGLAAARSERPRLVRAHLAYGVGLISLVWFSCQWPLAEWISATWSGQVLDPKLDVTNDLYGWPELRRNMVSSLGVDALRLPVAGSRYQTAAQAAFALGEGSEVSLLPRDLKSMDEWADIGVSEGQGPDWPRLLKPILYVADNRYDATPDYPGAACSKIQTFETQRYGYAAKTIYLWKCEPRSAQP